MKKIVKKIYFTMRIAGLGAGIISKSHLLYEAIRIQKNLYTKGINKPFKLKISNNKKNIIVNFRGTLDELHALTEIFIDRCYDPKIGNIKTILDLGANIGLASLWFWTEFPESIIHSYEADPEVFKFLERNLKQIPKSVANNIAIADQNGFMDFYCSERSFSSSLYSTPHSKLIRVQTKTLDETIRTIGGNVDLIKMDIEGAEFSVLEKTNMLNTVGIIIGEVHPEKANKKIDNLIEALSKTHTIDNDIGIGKSLFRATRLN